MDAFGPIIDYLIMVGLGAFAVGVHSYSMYGQRILPENNGKVHDPISSLALPTIAGLSAYRRGFVAYLFANESLYLLLTSSSIILELTLDAIGRQELVGALNSQEQLSPILPILASTAVITASQMRPFAQIEQSIRSVSHRIAGIPRNLDSVQEQIRVSNLEDIEQELQESGKSLTENSIRLLGNARQQAQAVSQTAQQQGLGVFEADNLKISLMRVHCIYEWTLGYDGEQIWVADDVNQITHLFDSLKLEFKSFRSKLQQLREESARPVSQASQIESWEKTLSDCLQLERRLTTVLSLLLINKPDVELRKYPALAYIREQSIDAGDGTDRAARNSLALSMLFGTIASFISMIVYLSLEKTWRDWESIEQAKLLTIGPFGQPAEAKTLTYWLQYFSNRMDNAFYETLDFVLIFSVSVIITLVVRDVMKSQKRWPSRSFHTVAPVGLYMYVGLLAYIPALLTFLLLKFIILNVVLPIQHGTEILNDTSLKAFPDYLPEIISVPLIAFVCVWFVCNFLDRRLWRIGTYFFPSIKFAFTAGSLNLFMLILRDRQIDLGAAMAAFFVPSLILTCLFLTFSSTYGKQSRSAIARTGSISNRIASFVKVNANRVFRTDNHNTVKNDIGTKSNTYTVHDREASINPEKGAKV